MHPRNMCMSSLHRTLHARGDAKYLYRLTIMCVKHTKCTMLINSMHPRNTCMSSLLRTQRARGDAKYTNSLNLLLLLSCTVNRIDRHYLGFDLLLFTGGIVSGLQPLSGLNLSQNLTSLHETLTITKSSRNTSVTSLLRSLRLLGAVNPKITLIICNVESIDLNHQPRLLFATAHRNYGAGLRSGPLSFKRASLLPKQNPSHYITWKVLTGTTNQGYCSLLTTGKMAPDSGLAHFPLNKLHCLKLNGTDNAATTNHNIQTTELC